ncbi:hypothetical protein [Winogradskyella rapida]|uniref:PqqD family protein n=1 Tax=Winogradskyella rapida TaxID=549701 RepID=A0ABW3KT27_9FLAO
MLNLFRKQKKEIPSFEILQNSEFKDKYFSRLSPWDWMDNKMIHVFDKNSPRVVTMDPWPQLIYLEATGQITVSEFVYKMASSYNRKTPIPKELDTTIISVLNDLIEDNLIELTLEKQNLTNDIQYPKSEQ